MVIGEWTVTGDEGRQLVPRGGTADLVKQVLAESGWQWLARHRGGAVLLFLAGLAAMLLGMGNPRARGGSPRWCAGLVFVVLAVGLGLSAAATSRAGSAVLEYAAPVVAADGAITVEVGNVPAWMARTGLGVWLGFVLGTLVALRGLYERDRWWLGCGLVLVVASFLSIRGGAPLFFGVVSLAGLFWLLPRVWRCDPRLRKPKAAEAVAAAVVLACMIPWNSPSR